VRHINIVFWFLVVIVMAAIWFLMSFCFKAFGNFLADLWTEAKEDITDENETNKEEK